MKYTRCLFFLCVISFQALGQINIKFELQQIPKSKDPYPQYFVAGNFNNWKENDTSFRLIKDANDHYALKKQLAPGDYEYKITRGSWTKGESNASGAFKPNRILKLRKDTTVIINVLNWADEFKQSAPVHTASANVKMLDSAFAIPQLNTKRRIWIYLPPSYHTSNKKYPVLYMHDGQNLFDEATGGFGEWRIDELLDSLSAKGGKESIVVGIANGLTERMKEYNPYDTQYGKGKGKVYVDFIVNNLKPYVDQHYRTKADQMHTSIAGSSMGGLISMYALSTYPKVFGNAGIFSPAFWLGRKMEEDIKSMVNLLKSNRIYFVAGSLEGEIMIRDMKNMFNVVNPTGKHKNIKLVEKADGQHKEWFWSREFIDFYLFVNR